MIEITTWFLKNFSMYRFGWFNDMPTDAFEIMSVFFLLHLGLCIISGIIHFSVTINFSKVSLFVVPMYILFNMLLIAILTLIGISIGGIVGFMVFTFILCIGIIFLTLNEDEEIEDLIGFFGFAGWCKNICNDYYEYKEVTNIWKKEYKLKLS